METEQFSLYPQAFKFEGRSQPISFVETIDVAEGVKCEVYPVDPNAQDKLAVEVNIGDVMQWLAEADSCLTVYEICIPPYQDGRYEDLG